ncbi:MAG TPA: hypothetical protein VFJ04_01365 [Rhodanobacteraceae bacterium]|nr:hypothetical protein [Rhodanobacteraceae bacterium]
MGKFTTIPDRALALADSAGENLRQIVPAGAGKWFQAGAKVGALRGGARVAGAFVRRNPAMLVAAAAGAGLLWYAAHRRARRAEQAGRADSALEGSARRVEPRRGSAIPWPSTDERESTGTGAGAGTRAGTPRY